MDFSWVIEHKDVFLLLLLAISEVIAVSPAKSNSIVQLVLNLVKALAHKA